MLRFPNCKINLGLFITDKRDDGFHDLETIFYPVPFNDVLEVVPAQGEASLHLSGKHVAGNLEDNLVWRAYMLLKEAYPDQVGELDIYLHKAVPMGAGLGGGSADGAYMLLLLNDYCSLGLSEEQLIEHSLKLGSDCPFFIVNKPVFAAGRGEKMTPIDIDLSAYSIQLICPQAHVSTQRAFRMITPCPPSYDLRKLPGLPIERWKYYVTNDFEAGIFSLYEELADMKDQLYEQGALYASMTGSGSTIFGIFPKGRKAEIESEMPFETHYVY